mgnify:CR=1 FL=1
MEFTVSGTTVRFDERTMQFAFTRDGAEWNTCADFKPTLQCAQGTFAFADATSITHEQRETGTGTGIRSIFTGFGHSAYSFETYVWVERASGDVLFEWIPLNEQGLNITNVTWPAAMDFDCADDHDTTLITHEQGVMIPNTWPTAVSTKDIAFDGRFETAGGSFVQADTGISPSAKPHGMPVTASTIPAMVRTPISILGLSQASAQ